MGDLSRYFNRIEFKCQCGECDCDTVDSDLLECLEDIRHHFEMPVTINSAHRCQDHNEAVGGASNSQHLYGRAADIVVQDIPPNEVYNYVLRYHPHMSIGKYNTFTHIDSRTNGPARW